MRAEAIDYLHHAGFDFKSVESPDLWTHLESHFYGRQRVGFAFDPLSPVAISDLIMQGEEALLDGLMMQHRKTGRLAAVTRVLDMPFIVGSDREINRANVDGNRLIGLIDQPGTAIERLIDVLPVGRESIPVTCQATVKGGLYADGHTVGFFDLSPGDHPDLSAPMLSAYLATPDEIVALAHEMEANIENIGLIPEAECRAMIKRAMLLKA